MMLFIIDMYFAKIMIDVKLYIVK